MRIVRAVAVLCLAIPVSPPAVSQESSPVDDPVEVLILGTFHMASPGLDVHNVEPDDVLSDRRQAEMEALADVLASFRPTKIAVEAEPRDRRIPERYAAYLAGEHELSRNETEQVGYRLAKRLGHERVYPVDADGEFPYLRLMKFATATGQDAKLQALQSATGASVQAFNEYLASHTLLEALLYMNSDAYSDGGVGSYFRLAEFTEPWDWAGPDLVADWFRRNMRIYGNLVGIVESPEDRLLVIYGAGHLGWLRYAFEHNPRFRLVTLADLVE